MKTKTINGLVYKVVEYNKGMNLIMPNENIFIKHDNIIVKNIECNNLYVVGNLSVKGYQHVEGDQHVEGIQHVEGD